MNIEIPAVVTQWLPDETLFSLASRYHVVSGNTRAASTCLQLFGHARQGSAHDLPCRLDEFANRTAGLLGDAERIACERTVLAYYWPFLSERLRQAAVAAMRGPGIGGLKFTLGLVTSRFRANHPLKACSECMRRDRVKWAVAYWHLGHQFPGVWMCPEHRVGLMACRLKSTGVQRFGWCLPKIEDLEECKLREEQVQPLLRLATIATEVGRLPASARGQLPLSAPTYQAALIRRGYQRKSGRLDFQRAAADFAVYARALRGIHELQALPEHEGMAQCLYRMLSPERSLTHPLWHLAFASWLFRSTVEWLACMEDAASVAAPNCTKPQKTRRSKDEAVLQTLREAGSARAAALALGVDVTTAIAWAAAAGLVFGSRPKKLKGETRLELLSSLAAGMDKALAAQTYGVSVSAITRTLRTQPGLHAQWVSARYDAAQTDARSRWAKLSLRNPLAGTSELRVVEPAVYAWLYRNDPAWLMAHRPIHSPRPPSVANCRVNWDVRDRILASDVEKTTLQLAQENPHKTIKLWQLYQRLPDLKAKLARLDRLPLTQAAVRRAIRTDAVGFDVEQKLLEFARVSASDGKR